MSSMFWSTLASILYTTIIFPIIWIVEHILALLITILAPFYHLVQYMLHIALIPLRLLGKLESLYIFFGTAVLLGAFTGLFIYAIAFFVGPLLGTNPSLEEAPRTAASYRAERAERKARKATEMTALGFGVTGANAVLESDWAASQNLGPPTPMMGTMILEEASSSE